MKHIPPALHFHGGLILGLLMNTKIYRYSSPLSHMCQIWVHISLLVDLTDIKALCKTDTHLFKCLFSIPYLSHSEQQQIEDQHWSEDCTLSSNALHGFENENIHSSLQSYYFQSICIHVCFSIEIFSSKKWKARSIIS